MLKSIIFSIIKLFPPEFSHKLVINLLKFYPFGKKTIKKDKLLEVNLLGYKLSNPIGLVVSIF